MKRNKSVNIGILIALGIVLNVIERYFVLPVPFVKLGLSYIIILIGLYIYDFMTAFIIALVKVLVSSIVFGYFLNPVFYISLSGNIGAVIVMAFFIKYSGKYLSIIGVSIIGSVAFNFTQLTAAYLIFIKRVELFSFFPVIILLSLITGFFVGIISLVTVEKLNLKNMRNNGINFTGNCI